MQTSFTLAVVNQFIKKAQPRDIIYCLHIPGFSLFKTATAASYRFRYTSATGKRREKTIGTTKLMKPQQAAEIAARWHNENADPLREQEASKKTFITEDQQAQLRNFGAYLSGAYSLFQSRKKSGKATVNMLNNNFKEWLNLDLCTLNKQMVQEWQYNKEVSGLAHATIKRAYGALKTMLNHAANNDIIKSNPLLKVSLAAASSQEISNYINGGISAERRQLTNAEYTKLKQGLELFKAHNKERVWFYYFALIALNTGLRPGDIASLTWQEFNITFKKLVKVPEKTRHHSEPVKIIMDLTDSLIIEIAPWWVNQGKPATGYVFSSPATSRQFSTGAYRKPWATVKRIAGLDESLHFYSIRHDFISRLVAAGVPMLTVAKLAGHKSTKMIENHYGHLCPASASNALKLLEGSRKPQPENAKAGS